MSKRIFVVLGVSLLCALPILGTFTDVHSGHERTARLAEPSQVLTAPLAY